MKFAKDTRWIERYIAIDIHKEYTWRPDPPAPQSLQGTRTGLSPVSRR